MTFSERTIVEGILAKERRAFEIMYETYFDKIYNYSLLQLGDAQRAEEVTEAVFTEVIDTLDRCHPPETLTKWIFQATRRRIARAKTEQDLVHPHGHRGMGAAEFFRLEETLLKHCHLEPIFGG